MKRKALWEPSSVTLSCDTCWMEMQTYSVGQIRHMEGAKIRCGRCGTINYLPSDLLARVKHVRPEYDPDNPLGRAQAWDNLIGPPSLKRALEIAIVGYHSLTFVGHAEDGWEQVQLILGPDRAMLMTKCPCGNLYSKEVECKCSYDEIEAWRASKRYKLANQSHIIIDVGPSQPADLFAYSEPWLNVMTRIKTVRVMQDFGPAEMDVRPTMPPFELLNYAHRRYRFSAESLRAIQLVACTIATMAGHDLVTGPDMAEALMYQTPLLQR